jgi:TonB-linked SusC/RagA family outer membrane protein
LFVVFSFAKPAYGQTTEINIKGMVTESGTGLPLNQVSISVNSTGTSAETDSLGAFTISVPDMQVEIIVDLPGYIKRNIFLGGRDFVNISLVSDKYRTQDNSYNSPLGTAIHKDAVAPVTSLTSSEVDFSKATSFDQVLQGRVPGMMVINQSGMPGNRTYMNIRGVSSLYGRSEPLLFIDGMIHDYSYSTNSLMEGFSINPLEIIDIDDISDITVLKDGQSYLGAAGSNGAIYVNSEQKGETSTVIKFSTYAGVALTPEKQNLLNPTQFKDYFTEQFNNRFPTGDIDAAYPWLNGNSTAANYYKYNNSTDWQDEIYKPASLQKYHFFLKGGDDIATYNISTGFLAQNGLYDNSKYTRFNLRINGKISITDKFSVTPNAKLSLADSYLPNQGYSAWKNPILSSLLIPPTMAPYTRDATTGAQLPYVDNTGIFDASNPVAIVASAQGTNRNYNFLSSVNAQYKFNEHFNLSTLVGLDFNNARENIFLPDIGLVQVDSASNSPGDLVNEFRSSQNHSVLTYTNQTASGHNIVVNGGFRYMKNSYKYDKGIDLNTPSDDFKSLGQGSKYNFLRTTAGDNRELVWASYFGSLNYNFRDKYFVDANVSYDGNSAVNADNRYNFYPSIGAGWRVSSESFLNQASWLEDFKLRASYSVTGNMFSNVYDYSKLFYVSNRMNNSGVLSRELIPNPNLELEKKNSINAGFDLSVLKQLVNLHFDVFKSNVDNLIVEQSLPSTYGYTSYFDNGGKLESTGMEISADTRVQFGKLVWTLGGSISKQVSKVTDIAFLDSTTNNVISTLEGCQIITSAGNPVNAFYGFKTDGIYASDADAAGMTGPRGAVMGGGDVKYLDLAGSDNIINEADKTIIGDPTPDFFGSINTGLSYGRFELSALFTYSVGNDIFNYVRYKTESMNSYNNQSATVLDRWTPTNTTGTMPKAAFGDPAGNTLFSDRWIEDGSYFKLKQLTVNYNIPRLTGIYKGITIYVTASNLLTLTKYSGYDPDFMYMNNPYYMGIDYGKIPQTRSFIVGLKLDL